MGYEAQTRDLTSQYLGYGRILSDYRPVPSANFAPGTACQLVSLDAQIYPDAGTIQPCTIVAAQQFRVVGVVAEIWPGFNGQVGPQTFIAPWTTNPRLRGTQGVLLVVQGYHPSVLVDQSDPSGSDIDIVDGTILVPSLVTAGAVEGATDAPTDVGMGAVGIAMLPASGPLASLPAGALLQASGTVTFSTTLANGSTATVTLTLPSGPTLTFTYTNNTGANVTAGTLATTFSGLIAASGYWTTSVAGSAITIVATGKSYVASANNGLSQFPISLSGAIGNGVTGTNSNGTVTAPSGGTGYLGTVPAFIKGAAC